VNKWIGLLALGLGAMGVMSRVSARPAGDIVSSPRAPGGEPLFLPKFSLGSRGVYTFTVNRPGVATYPHWIRFKTRATAMSRQSTEFEEAVIRVEVLDAGSGAILHTRAIRPRQWQVIDGDEFQHVLWGRPERRAFTRDRYTLRITVLEPSSQEVDEAWIVAAPAGA